MEGSHTSSAEDRARWARLTEKQRACLDLLLERKTSKQIARALDISKYTVDQRITAARLALDAADRADTAVRYERLKQICDRVVYDAVEVPPAPSLVASDFPGGGASPLLNLHDSGRSGEVPSGTGLPSGKFWRHDHLVPIRILIMAAVLTAGVIFYAGSVGIAEALSRLVSS